MAEGCALLATPATSLAKGNDGESKPIGASIETAGLCSCWIRSVNNCASGATAVPRGEHVSEGREYAVKARVLEWQLLSVTLDPRDLHTR